MLQNIRNASQHWLGKIVMSVIFFFLIAGVAIFGVEEFFRGGSSTAVATVGKTQISAESVRTAYQNQLNRYQQQLKRMLTPEQARALGLERQVLSQLITEAALDQKTSDLGLAISDEAVLRTIREEQAFKGTDGKFDRTLFYQTLSRAGINEAMFVREQRAVAARLQLADAVTAELSVPQALREAVHRYASERRTAAVLMLTPAAAGDIPAPTDDELKAYYDNNKGTFRASEMRGVNLVVLDPEAMAKPDTISDEEARKIYDANAAKYGTPERRTIQQITFPDEAAAEAARKQIESGEMPFEGIATARGVDPKNLSLGNLTKAELFDPAVGDAAFALEKDKVSAPVKGRFGTVLLRITAIEPATQKPFDEVKDEIRKAMALQRARDGLETAHDAIEDARASGKSLADIAKERELPLVEIPAVDAQGKDATGKKVEGIPDPDTTLAAAFRSEMGGDSEALRTKSGGYVWYDVTKIEAAHDKPLDEVRDEAIKGWKEAEISKRLAAKAKELVERLDKGETPEAVSESAGVQAKTIADLARNQAKDDLSTEVIDRIFATAVDKAGSAPSGENRAVFKVTRAEMPAFEAGTPTDKNAEKSFRTTLSDDVLGEYIADVQKNAGVSVNQTAFKRALGGEY
ncbi:SurA N-terminal domain-containing protein [Methylobacterium gnaphalii]|uniref:Parvulin-like PPIase n=1 Tax=Methylobacterium gnaphalii TaxID=1010610 RepID=A0A512JJ33_9HYPH|nr:SurA N-terminal domain-containing protein [Methylobacterium gnaphalii]GEP09978.1 peptidylprolyl isomerase [Methylobacterium gnaphalii]GJD68972.1 Foldase protein PrsA [Methylobacterium gnaphalii]GLS48249.1 peptidylprolyl isomerase [Methylobacterium gnaphalii]